MHVLALVAASILAASTFAVAARPAGAETPNAFFQGGPPTFVIGTGGDELADRACRVQVDLVRGMLFPCAQVVRDVEVDALAGRDRWPARPVLYGNPSVNGLLAAIADDLPVRFEPDRLIVGDRAFVGQDVRLIACFPATARHPELLVYAGVAALGVTEINSVAHGGESFLVADRFGRLVAGTWERGADGRLVPKFGPDARRERWHACPAAEGTELACALTILRLDLVKADPREAAEDAAIRRGVARAVERLGAGREARIAIYVHPDARSKQLLTGNGGAGHADLVSDTVHVLRVDAAPGGALELLVAHEATHVLAHRAFGPCASALLGEGLAVWVSGHYRGRALADWRAELPRDLPAVHDLLGRSFRALPEAVTYPAAGVFVGALIEEVGLDRAARHLLPANAEAWPRACTEAGTSAEAVEALFRRAVLAPR